MDIASQNVVIEQCQSTKSGSRKLITVSTPQKDQVLQDMARILGDNRQLILDANQIDIKNGIEKGLSEAMLDRLKLTTEHIQQMQQALYQVAKLDDPLEKTMPTHQRPNGIKVTKKVIPLGVILMIYESRPNVTVEAAALALKSGNGIILRGGKEAFESNQAIAKCWQLALAESDLDAATIRILATTDRRVLDLLLKQEQLIDVVIPRGGESLIKHVVANSHIPVIKHYKGVCHLYVDQFADINMAIDLLLNGKTQRPGVCNALEGVIVHQSVANAFLPKVMEKLANYGVTVFGCEKSRSIVPQIEVACKEHFLTEFLCLKLSMKVVEGIEQAVGFIEDYGSGHTEVIVTQNSVNAERFVNQVDASVVMVNASSRFSDGGELGLGAEIGISTSKLHAYGPMGLESLTSEKFVVHGEGQIR